MDEEFNQFAVIMYSTVVVKCSKELDLIGSIFIKSKLVLWLNVAPVDDDILVAVVTTLFVLETSRVHQFVLNNVCIISTSIIKRDRLTSNLKTTYITVAPAFIFKFKLTSIEFHFISGFSRLLYPVPVFKMVR